MLALSIVLLICSIATFIWIVYRIVVTKKLKFKDVVYTIAVFITYYFLLVQTQIMFSETPVLHIFLESFKPAIKFVGLDFESEIFKLTLNMNNYVSATTYVILCIDSIVGFLGIVFVLFKVALINKIRFYKAKHCFKNEEKVVDSIFSFNEITKKYLTNLSFKDKKHTIVYLNKTKDGMNREQMKEAKSFLYALKIAYKEATINELAFRKCACKYDNNVVSFFTDNNEILTFTKEAKKYLDNNLLVINLYDTDGSIENNNYKRFSYYETKEINGRNVQIENEKYKKLLNYLFDNKVPFYINQYSPKNGEEINFKGTDIKTLEIEDKNIKTKEICIKSLNDIDYLVDKKLLNLNLRKNIKFILLANREQNHFLKPVLAETHGFMRSFDKYELCSIKFAQENNFAKYIRKTDPNILNDNLTIKDCDINLFFFGFGSMNKSLFEKLLVTTQFVEEKEHQLVPKRMNVHIYDKNKDFDSLLLSTGILNYARNDFLEEKDQYFELPLDYRNIDFNFSSNLLAMDVFKEIAKEVESKKKVFNFFIVSLGDDFTNINFADKLNKSFKSDDQHKNVIFLNTKRNLVDCGIDNKQTGGNIIEYFGQLDDLLNRDNVVLDKFYECCRKRNYFYEGGKIFDESAYSKKLCDQHWNQLSYIKRDSNASSVAGISFKLSLLGFDNYNFDIKDYNEKYFGTLTTPNLIYNDITQYGLTNGTQKYNIRDVFSFMEHERWNAHQLSHGVLPLKKEELKELHGKTKSCDETRHANLTTSKGLLEFYNYLHENADSIDGFELYDNNGNDNAEVFKYDYQLMDDFEKYQKYFKD